MKARATNVRNTRTLAAVSVSFALAGIASAAPSTTVMISQVYGGGGNSGATYTNDFVELHNNSTSSVALTGWTLQYASATATGSSSSIPLSGTIAPGGYFLIMLASQAAVGAPLPVTPDLTNTAINMSGTTGKVALVNNATFLTAADFSGTAPIGADIVDFVGYGTTPIYYEGAGRAPAPSSSLACLRASTASGTTDTDNNNTDFTAVAPNPRNSLSPVLPADTIAPLVSSTAPFSPADEATGVGIASPLSITFNEPIAKGTGNLTVKLASNNSTVYTVDVTTAAVAVAGSTATITLPGSLSSATGYYVNIDPTAFKDNAGNAFAGITGGTTWNFTTGVFDNTPPALVSLSPADDSTGVAPLANLVITYDDTIVKGSGNIVIKKSSDNSVVETIPVGDAKVSVSGAVATINPATVLAFNTGYYVEVAAGAFADSSTNGTAVISGASTWNFVTKAAPTVLISQYYEGAGSNRFVELQNLTASPLSLDGYRLTAWSNTAPATNQDWKSGTGTTDRDVSLTGFTIPANGHLLVANSGAAAPTYAVVAADLKDTSYDPITFFNGDDSVVLYQGATNALGNVVDAVSFVANSGADISFYRLNNQQGFDFSTGSSIVDYSSVWATKPLADVASAATTDPWYLAGNALPESLSISFNNTSFSEAAGAGASTATVTRTGPTTNAIFLNITVNDETEVSVATPVTLPAGQASTTFPVNAVNDTLRDGNKTVTITVEAEDYIPATGQVTVTDDGLDQAIPVVINEVDADSNDGTDTAEFIELYNTSGSTVSLDGHVIVLYNGNLVNDPSYRVIDLTGYTIAAHDYFVIGSTGVPNLDLEVTSTEWIQNGADAVVLRVGAPTEFPTDSALTTADASVVDAVVYDTSDADDTSLLSALTPGQPQVNEDAGGNGITNSIARVPDGGAPFVTGGYVAQAPTPGTTNGVGGGNNFNSWATDNGIPGALPNDDNDHDGIVNLLEYALGFNPKVNSQPVGTLVNGLVSYPKGAAAVANGDVSYKIQTSPTLATGSWTDVTPTTSNSTTITYQLPAPTAAQPKLFTRLVVTQAP